MLDRSHSHEHEHSAAPPRRPWAAKAHRRNCVIPRRLVRVANLGLEAALRTASTRSHAFFIAPLSFFTQIEPVCDDVPLLQTALLPPQRVRAHGHGPPQSPTDP